MRASVHKSWIQKGFKSDVSGSVREAERGGGKRECTRQMKISLRKGDLGPHSGEPARKTKRKMKKEVLPRKQRQSGTEYKKHRGRQRRKGR